MADVHCGAPYPCLNDQDNPCFCAPVGPQPRRWKVRPSPAFVHQVRALGDRRYPLSAVPSDVVSRPGQDRP